MRLFSRNERIAMGAAVVLVTALYILCWYPGPGGRVWFGDSVSFQFYAISHSLGHPPGYPQYLALTRLIASVPIGRAWQRVNFVSSLFGALALCAHYALSRIIGLHWLSALGASLVLGLAQIYVTQASEAEVYALNSFWVFTCSSLFALYLRTRARRALWAFFIAYGLALGHHPTMVLLVLPVAITSLAHARSVFKDWQAYAAAVFAIVIGLAQYLYTFKLFTDPNLTFRFAEYREYNLTNFIDFTTGGQYKGRMFSQPIAAVLRERLPHVIDIASSQNSLIFVALGLIGLAAMRNVVAGTRTLVALYILANLSWALGYDVEDIDSFCTPLWAFCYLGVVEGARAMLPKHNLRVAFALTVALSFGCFWRVVLRTGYLKPENTLVAIADEYIAAVPPDGVLLPWKLNSNSALQSLFRYFVASGDRGQIRTVRYVKHCDPHLYFTNGGRKQIRLKRYGERRVGRLEKCGEDLFVMECGASPP